MKRNIYLLLMLTIFLYLTSCEEKEAKPSITAIDIELSPEQNQKGGVVMGDSISFSINAKAGSEALSSIKAQIYFDNEPVSEKFFPTNNSGAFSGKLYIPHFPALPPDSAIATLKIVVKDRLFETTESKTAVKVLYPEFEQVTFVTAQGNYPMTKTTTPYLYKYTGNFPVTWKGFFDATRSRGDVIRFGIKNGKIASGGKDSIMFLNEDPNPCDVTFNVHTYQALPMIAVKALVFAGSGATDEINVEMHQGEDVLISGIDAYETWWTNPAFFAVNKDGSLRFKAIDGRYKLRADYTQKFIDIKPVDENGSPLAFNDQTGEGAIWVNGSANIGIPTTANTPGWNAAKSFAMAPTGNKKYQLYLTAGTSLNVSFNFKFFPSYNVFTEFFTSANIETDAPVFRVDTSENGNIKPGETAIESGKTYILTIDASTRPDNKVILSAVEYIEGVE